MTSALLALLITAAPCELRPLEREEAKLARVILATPDEDVVKLRALFEEWDRITAKVDACKVALAEDRQLPGN
ncbi:MAG: hypothetical protein HY928_14340 [Elusimicrobia bacterium]|nr:hypothetical protein [Elusimicrobiota bacterium]